MSSAVFWGIPPTITMKMASHTVGHLDLTLIFHSFTLLSVNYLISEHLFHSSTLFSVPTLSLLYSLAFQQQQQPKYSCQRGNFLSIKYLLEILPFREKKENVV